MLANEVLYANFTVIYEPEPQGDIMLKFVRLRKDSALWDETHVLDSVCENPEERRTVGIIAVLPGHVSCLWGCAIPES